MYPKRSWKNEKDVFGKKHRQYFLNNVFGADVYDMKTFRALKRKLERDYKGFFGSLNKLYERGEFKNVAKESLSLTNRVVNLIDSMIESGVINKKEVDIIVQHVGMLNERRDILVQKSGEVKALKGKLSTIESSTGIRPEDLNITGKIVRSGARREAKKGREGVLPFLKRTMPKTSGLAGEVFGGVATAGFGPFTPLAKMVGGAGSDIFGLGKGIFQKFGERNERKLGGNLRSVASQLSEGEVGGIGGARGIGTGLSHSVETKGRKVNSDALFDFYNKGAYRAKWTKELLKRTKEGEKGKLGISGLADKFISLGSSLLPLIGSAGVIAGTVGAFVFAKNRLTELVGKISEYMKVKGVVGEEIKEQEKKQVEIRTGIAGTMTEAARAGNEPKRKFAFEQLQGAEVEKVQKEASWYDKLFMKRWGAKSPSSMAPAGIVPPDLVGSSGKMTKEQQRELLQVSGSKTNNSQEKLTNEVQNLNKSIADLSKNIQQGAGRRGSTSIKEPGIGNPWNSSDPFSNSFSIGNLEWSDE